MNVETLRVFNAMYELGLTEEQIISVKKEAESGKSGMKNFYKVKYNGKHHLVYVDHNKRDENIRIKKCNIDLPLPSRIICKTLIEFDPPDEVYALHQIGRYHSYGDEDKWGYAYKAKDLEELKICILDKFKDKEYRDLDSYKMYAIFWLFGEKYEKTKDEKIIVGSGNYRKDITTIAKVFEIKNRRLAIFRESTLEEQYRGFANGRKSTGEYNERISYSLSVFKPTHELYNWVDEGREIVKGLWLCSELKGKITPAEAIILNQRLGRDRYSSDNKDVFLSLSDYNDMKNSLRLDMMKAKQEYDQKVLKEQYQDSLIKKFNKNEKVTRGGILFSKKGIEYEGLIIAGDMVDKFVSESGVLQEEEPDFNTLVTAYVQYLIKNFPQEPKDYKITLGRVTSNIKIMAKKRINWNYHSNFTNYRFYINEKRIRTDEVSKILLLSFNQPDQETYDEWLSETSRLSLRLRQILDYGFNFHVEINQTEDNDLTISTVKQINFNLKIVREKGKNYVLIKGEKYKITGFDDFYKLKDLNDAGGTYYEKKSKLDMLIKRLSKLKDITPDVLGSLLEEGKKFHNERVKKSEKFVQNAVRIANAKRVGDGYIVKGISGAEYHIEIDTLRVHGWVKRKKANYICIVDLIDGHEQSVTKLDMAERNDALAKRILALSKDKKIAGEVFTVKNHLSNRSKGIIEESEREDIVNLVEV
jgi:hypothetical protein